MTDDPLYPRALLRLAADAKGAGRLARADAVGAVHNPACGDKVTVELTLAGGRITALAHQTRACVLTQASAALLADAAPGSDRGALAALKQAVTAMLTDGTLAPVGYEVFAGVAGHTGRHTCVLLPLQATLKALEAAEEGAVGS
jgi:nitrogen fixation NifU-like protein